MHPALRETASRVTARVVGSRFAKPLARAVLAAAGLLLLAFIGRTTVASAVASPASLAAATSAALAPASASLAPAALAAGAAVDPSAPATGAGAASATGPPTLGGLLAASPSAPAAHTQATPDDPVFLNTATVDDLRRLPGVGEKKASAIVALRTRLGGRLHAVEDLLKVKGIGRTTLRRLRPLVRLDPSPAASAGPPTAASTPDGGTGESPR